MDDKKKMPMKDFVEGWKEMILRRGCNNNMKKKPVFATAKACKADA